MKTNKTHQADQNSSVTRLSKSLEFKNKSSILGVYLQWRILTGSVRAPLTTGGSELYECCPLVVSLLTTRDVNDRNHRIDPSIHRFKNWQWKSSKQICVLSNSSYSVSGLKRGNLTYLEQKVLVFKFDFMLV